MLSLQPQPTPYDLRFTFAGVPVRVHPFFWLLAILLGANAGTDVPSLAIFVAVVFVSILVHEFGHVLAFGYFGQRAHVVLWAFGGLAIPGDDSPWSSPQGDSWGGRFQSQRRVGQAMQQIIISLAGPAAGFLLAALVPLMLFVAGRSIRMWLPFVGEFGLGRGGPIEIPYVYLALVILVYVNVFWGVLNLMPVFPLDGGQATRALLQHVGVPDATPRSLLVSMIAAIALAIGGWVYFSSLWIAIMFGLLAYQSYQQYALYSGGGRW